MFRSPTGAGLPCVQTMLADIPATPRQIAAHLGIKESTLATYKRTNNAPRAILVALFWETRWGRSAADQEAANAAQTHLANTKMLQSHISRMAGIIWKLEFELSRHAGSRPANLPIFNVA